MKRTRMIIVVAVLLLAIANSSVIAMADGGSSQPNPRDTAIYLKDNFTALAGNNVKGNIFSAEGNIVFQQPENAKLEGDAIYSVGKLFTPPGTFSGGAYERGDLVFGVTLPVPPDFPSITYKVNSNNATQPYTVSQDTHFTTLTAGTAALTVDTSGGDIHIVADKLVFNNGGKIKVTGNGKVFLYIKNFVNYSNGTYQQTGYSLQINNENSPNNPNKTIIISKSQLKFETGNNGLYAHVFYTQLPQQTTQLNLVGRLVGSLVYDGAKKLMFQSSSSLKGLAYAPAADVVLTTQANPNLEGRIVAKSLEMRNGANIVYGTEYIELFRFDGSDPEPDPGEPVFPSWPDPAGYKHGILGTYYDSYEPNEPAKKVMKIDSNVAFNWEYDLYPHGTMGRDNFSIVWEGKYRAPATGTYKFKTLSDDGVKLWIGGNKIIENWGLYSFSHTTSGEITLTGGQLYDIRLDYQQGPLYAAVFLFWEYNGTDMGLVPNDHLFVTDSVHDAYSTPVLFNDSVSKSGTGFENKFYSISAQDEDPTGGTPALTETNNIAYNWGWSAPGSITTDMFFGTMEGMLEAKFTEDLTLVFIVDDAIRVWVDNVLVIDEWDYHNGTEFTHQFQVQSGQKYHIKVEYADFYLSGSVYMGWESGSIVREIVPKEYMYLTN